MSLWLKTVVEGGFTHNGYIFVDFHQADIHARQLKLVSFLVF